MRIGIAYFTDRGGALSGRVEQALAAGYGGKSSLEILRYERNLKEWCGRCFEEADGIVFIGACGIAVRTIAPFLKGKTMDPAVIVLDEKGQFVISLLSGHIGGANELALLVAEGIGAVPVITTASDVNGKIAVDVFAKKNHLAIGSMTAAKKVEAAILRGEKVGVYCKGRIEGNVPPELFLADAGRKADFLIWISEAAPTKEQRRQYLTDPEGTVLHLIPRSVILGVGCRRGKTAREISQTAFWALEEAGIPSQALAMAASIDLKKEEPGILEFCKNQGIGLETYSAAVLENVEGEFQPSEFVRKTTGVDNVCERAALAAAGAGGRLIRKKYAADGVTAALAVRDWRICFEK